MWQLKDTAVNLGIIFSNLNQRKSSRWRNSQDLVVTFCSRPFAPFYHELTLNESAQTRERKTTTSPQRPLACLGREKEAYFQRGHTKQEAEPVWPAHGPASEPVPVHPGVGSGNVSLVPHGARLQWLKSAASDFPLQPKHVARITTLQP